MTDYPDFKDFKWRAGFIAALFVVGVCVGITSLNLAIHPVKVVTRTVQADPGKPAGSIAGEQLNPQLKGLTCDYWRTQNSVTFVCKAA